MTASCRHCGSVSRVVLTRRITTEDWSEPRTSPRRHNHNIIRTRQCVECRWKWKTQEKTYVEKSKKA